MLQKTCTYLYIILHGESQNKVLKKAHKKDMIQFLVENQKKLNF